MRSNDEGIHRDTSVMEMVMSEESVFTQDHSKRISEVDTASFNAFSQKQTKMDLLLAPKGKTEPLHLSQDEIRSACRKEKLGGILCEETHGVDETNEILPQFKLGNYKCVGEELPVSASVLKHPETEGALNWLEEMTNNTEDKITGSSSTGETMTGNQAESTGKEISEGFLDKSIDYIKCLIQRNKLAKEGIKEKLFEIKSVEIAEDNCSSNEDLHDFEEEIEVHEMSSSCLTDEFFFNSKIKYRQQSNRKLLFTQQNHSLKQQVKTLQDEVCHLKQVNHCLVKYKEIAKSLEMQIKQLKEEKLQFEQKIEGLHETIKALQQDQIQQGSKILSHECKNIALVTKIEMLYLEVLKKEHLVETIGKLEAQIKELHDEKAKIVCEKSEIENSFKKLQVDLVATQKQLTETEEANKVLQMQLKKMYAYVTFFKEECKSQMQEKDKFINLSAELEGDVCRKETEIEHLKNIKKKLENAISCLQRTEEEKGNTDKQHLLSKTELNQNTNGVTEMVQIKAKDFFFSTDDKTLLVDCETEHTETENLKQQISKLGSENLHLNQLLAWDNKQKESIRHKANKRREQFNKDTQIYCEKKNGGISAVSEGTKHTVHLLKVKLDEYYKHKNEQNELIAKMESLLEQKCKLCKRLVPENIRLQRRVNSLRYKVHTINQALQTQMAALPAIFQNHTRTICSSHGCHQETDIHLRSGHQHHTQPAY
ncbi:cancer-associated gene 1 protein homolog [Latimeria chalumnae]|uniref:cancer-associated gene 1 protein homolog n=1 Tax=Latimeria chalumnae TaxID=7897 RepID=UPI0006D92C56|nr:PREDICTED: cancer-associated gene 1 protein homolog isoform X2 [Latimeria chalumnae]XP_014346861.1 PREDICTED: cancer-associated gene 1 protein homolog isoform X2 [Latimeria chalumnae]XP_014346862.1 PREDICTED: cancer-associated gene 1 protein homolog isoform X2 [Latimeria chalumnae]|eukprot:XP_014346860.1 PREDICTED: cancer-associated gene 1 protein homolog isoform X2 [Latimeria chalumnae]